WDVARRWQEAGGTAQFSDFDFSAWPPATLTAIGYRISKEKAVVHHIINAALERLRPGGVLWLAGHKQEGIRTYVAKAAARAGAVAELERLAGGGTLAAIRRGAALGAALDDQHYSEWRELAADAVGIAQPLATKPGIFGWQKIDAGSALLLQAVPEVWPAPPERLLDLGSGYGLLAVYAASRWPGTTIVATDNNAAAVAASQRNLAPFGERAGARPSDAGAELSPGFDALLCNPPFHRGFGTADALNERFIAAAARLLRPGGQALFVVNAFIPLEQRSRGLFRRITPIIADRSFKVVALAR
ncbi:MAG: methyltransferase, partial [Spongiibacteraceae bacterium]|nr:methyltransferase [Spongiibacteraceae bacterium]